MVRNEVDVIAACALHHLAMGVDGLTIIDNDSTDGTPRVLGALAQADPRLRWRTDRGLFTQAVCVTELAREAARQGADWVVLLDADEFWWAPRAKNVRQVLQHTPPSVGVLRSAQRKFIQRRE